MEHTETSKFPIPTGHIYITHPHPNLTHIFPEYRTTGSSKTLVTMYKTMWWHNPQDQNPNVHCRKNLKSHTEVENL